MMDKIVRFQTHDDIGRCFAEALHVRPSGTGHEKVAGELHPELKKFIQTLQPDPRYQYVLMTPMGAFEYWGMNVNGDVFPEASLAFDSTKDNSVSVARALEDKWLRPFGKTMPPGNYKEFGYKTFMNALRYRHHVNKNPEIAYGDIVFTIWNPAMKRVECIARHDREKAKRVGAEEIIRDLDEGKPRQISMGCKVPFDVCTVCGHVSRTPHDYCEHLKFEMGSIRPDGKVVGAVNFFPRFFDLSDVFVPAAKESGVLMKVARDTSVPFEEIKQAAVNKVAEMDKKVLPNAASRAMLEANKAEPDIPKDVLRRPDFSDVLSTLAMLGIVLKPSEFQFGMLNRMGHSSLADRLFRERRVFSPVSYSGPASLSANNYTPSIARLVSSLIPHRSGFYPHLPKRMIKITVIKKAPPKEEMRPAPQDTVLSKVASAYAMYRKSLRSLPTALNIAVESDPEYYSQHFFSDLIVDSMNKTASVHGAFSDKPLVSQYLYSAHGDEVMSPPRTWAAEIASNSPAKALLGPVL